MSLSEDAVGYRQDDPCSVCGEVRESGVWLCDCGAFICQRCRAPWSEACIAMDIRLYYDTTGCELCEEWEMFL